MKISFPSLFQTPLNKYTIFFIFGNDTTVFERAISFIHKKLQLPLQMKTEEDILQNASSQPSLFQTQDKPSLSLISPVTDKILGGLEQMKNGNFILTSEKARAQSKLVTHFSQSSTSLAIAAYASPLTTSEFEFLTREMDLPVSFKGILFKAYQNDSMGLLATLERIKLYGNVPEDLYDSFLSVSTSSEDFTPLIHAFLLKNSEKAIKALSDIALSDMIPILRNLSRSFQTLFELMPLKKNPKSIAWNTLTPPVFFKEQPIFETALSRWNSGDIKEFLEALLTLERQVKFSRITLSQIRHPLLAFLPC